MTIELTDERGQGGSIGDAAVVLAQAGRTLISGPLLPTVIASAVVSLARDDAQARGPLARFAQGGTGVVVAACHGITISDGERPRINGHTGLVLGAASADLLIVAAGDGDAWFVSRSPTSTNPYERRKARSGSHLHPFPPEPLALDLSSARPSNTG